MFERVEAPETGRSPVVSRTPLSGSGEERTAGGVEGVARERHAVGQVDVLAAAIGGHLEVLQWVRANGCPWDERTCWGAAEGGHLEVLQWARANGCPWSGETCEFAAKGGDVEVLRWACANGCPYGEKELYIAAQNGHEAVVQVLKVGGCERQQGIDGMKASACTLPLETATRRWCGR